LPQLLGTIFLCLLLLATDDHGSQLICAVRRDFGDRRAFLGFIRPTASPSQRVLFFVFVILAVF
jgi:hypothetical protein